MVKILAHKWKQKNHHAVDADKPPFFIVRCYNVEYIEKQGSDVRRVSRGAVRHGDVWKEQYADANGDDEVEQVNLAKCGNTGQRVYLVSK
ncbi:hypothetical protein DSM101010T_31910 [Desulfovibrio subterraneus]|uniref:Uncharacterized protein n=1 Tax=Desulfovibrio subterraneus TaxID=2718620 RepID=A0A7J0BMC3_9BACT|nr:hypothetical protein DSM101010T_31910 [Desulfovibrio subterraneus]